MWFTAIPSSRGSNLLFRLLQAASMYIQACMQVNTHTRRLNKSEKIKCLYTFLESTIFQIQVTQQSHQGDCQSDSASIPRQEALKNCKYSLAGLCEVIANTYILTGGRENSAQRWHMLSQGTVHCVLVTSEPESTYALWCWTSAPEDRNMHQVATQTVSLFYNFQLYD